MNFGNKIFKRINFMQIKRSFSRDYNIMNEILYKPKHRLEFRDKKVLLFDSNGK